MADRRRIWLHPITLVVLAVAVGVVLNFVIWRAVYGEPPTVAAQFFVPGLEVISKPCCRV